MPPGQLFRLLLKTPRPLAQLSYRLSFAPDISLFARALHHMELSDVRDGDDVTTDVIVSSLCDSAGAPIATREIVLGLEAHDQGELYRQLSCALQTVSPSYDRSDLAQWDEALKSGARENYSMTVALGGSYDEGFRTVTERPDRYFGVPLCELLDGHWMAYRAACVVLAEWRRRSDRE